MDAPNCFPNYLPKINFAVGVFSLLFYCTVIAGSALQISVDVKELDDKYIVMNYLLMTLSSFCVIASIILLIGLCVESRSLFLPWIVSVILTNAFNVIFTISTQDISKEVDGDLTFDLFICAMYSIGISSVLSQYFKYGRNSVSRHSSAERKSPSIVLNSLTPMSTINGRVASSPIERNPSCDTSVSNIQASTDVSGV